MADRVAKPVPTTTDAVDVAMDMAGDGDAARTLLAKHGRLIDAQIRTERLEHRNKAALIAFRSILALAALFVVVGFCWMIANARRDRGLVIEALSVPPDLAARGMTGQTMAAALADKLAEIDRTARSFRSAQTMTVNWGNDVKIQIPETGVSIGEVDAFLRRALGHQTVIGGAAFRAPQGLHLTVRVGGSGAIDQVGKDTDIDAMLQKAAEGVFAQTQAYRYSKYLEFKGRRDEAMAVARQIVATSDDRKERAWAWAQVSNLLLKTDSVGAIRAAQRGMREDPDNPLNYINGGSALAHLRHDRLRDRWFHQGNVLGLRPQNGLSEVGINQSQLNSLAEALVTTGDVQQYVRRKRALQGPTFYTNQAAQDEGQDRGVAVLLHDVGGVLANPLTQPDAAYAKGFSDLNAVVDDEVQTAMLLEDYPRAIALVRDLMAVYAANPESPHLSAIARDRFLLPDMALALAKNGQLADAQRLAAAFPADCEGCSIVAAQIAVEAGNYDVARRIVTAIARSPVALPLVAGLAQIEQRAGRYAAALAAADRVVAIGPNFADGHKARGDALRRLGRTDEAVAEYQKAATIAPKWTRLYIDWAIAEIERGDKAMARGKLAAARRLYQVPSDQRAIAAVTRLAA